ncbi:MAG: FAD-dependent oxidoreductase [Gammaproteobacteria bacterium]|nr:FAD-dependent oxidoreductase [Gammaproteobacteria bacterium]
MTNQTQARTVIIGGGIMGCSLAYHLCKEGETDILLLEKGELTSGSTWHAAGQITHSVSHYALAKMAAYGTQLYPQLESETGHSCSWHGCGSLRLAYQNAEVDWLRYTASIGRGIGHDMEIIDPDRIHELHPFYNLDGVKTALHTPNDGHVDPAGVTFAMARGARMMGCTILRNRRVVGMKILKNGEFSIQTGEGEILAERIVNAAGTYARQIGAWVGLDLPIANLLHHYLVTEPVPEFANLESELPVVRDDQKVSGYIRMEQKSGLIGIYEKANATTVWDQGTPWESQNELFEPDLERIMPWLENAMERMPVFAKLGIRRVVHGAITHPPDGNMLLGPCKIPNYWLCCGSQVGIAWGPGAGKYLAQWMTYGAADIAMNSFDPMRFGARIDDTYRIEKAKEDYLLRHEIPFPNLDRPNCRPSHSRITPLYDVLKQQGAVYQDIGGWERPYWYATDNIPQQHIESFIRTHLHRVVEEEVKRLRTHAGIADLSAFSKLELSGKHASQFLNRISSNKIPVNQGSITLTYLIAKNGRIEGETTLVKLADQHYYLVYAAAREAYLFHWLCSQRRKDEEIVLTNVSNKFGVILLAGPAARRILSQCTDTRLDNTNFRWLSAKSIKISNVENIRAMRVTYTGELGWELHIPVDQMLNVYTTLMNTSLSQDIVHIGSASLNAMRMEKAYRSGHEITSEVTVAEADVMRFSRTEGFQGANFTIAEPVRWKLVYMKLEEPRNTKQIADPLGGETILYKNQPIGHISSGGYGYEVEQYLAFGYVRPEFAQPGTEFEVLVLNSSRKASVITYPQYDSSNLRPRSND